MTKDSFQFADELGPYKVIHVYEPSVGLKGTLVVDNVAKGPSIGGLRMAPDVSTSECFRLARAMTLKNAAAGLPHGGGKSVIYADPKMPKSGKANLIRAFAHALRHEESYIFGPDMGTDEECMAWIRDETGRRSVGLPREVGGIPLDEIGATGWGLSRVAAVAAKYVGFSLEGARVVVQGFGSVGKHAAKFLADQGAMLIAASDSQGAVLDDNGLDITQLAQLKSEGKSVVDYSTGKKIENEALLDVDCDIWIPAARPDVIHEDNVGRLSTKLFLQGANIPITVEAEKMLYAEGTLYIPDFIANAGGVICAAMEYQGASQSAAMATIEEKLKRNTEQVLTRVKEDGIDPRHAAIDLAQQRVRKAMSFRRYSLSSSAPDGV